MEQPGLAPLQRHHLLLDRAGGDHPVDHHRAGLADPVRAVHRLRFRRGVPPRVEQEHVVGLGEGQPEPAGLQADQEHRGFSGAEALDHLAPAAAWTRRGTRSAMPAASRRSADEIAGTT